MSTWRPFQHSRPRSEQCGRWTIEGSEAPPPRHQVLPGTEGEFWSQWKCLCLSSHHSPPRGAHMGQRRCFGLPSPCSTTSLDRRRQRLFLLAERSCGCQYSVIMAVIHILVSLHVSKALAHLTLLLNMTGILLVKRSTSPALCPSLLVLWCQKMWSVDAPSKLANSLAPPRPTSLRPGMLKLFIWIKVLILVFKDVYLKNYSWSGKPMSRIMDRVSTLNTSISSVGTLNFSTWPVSWSPPLAQPQLCSGSLVLLILSQNCSWWPCLLVVDLPGTAGQGLFSFS